MPAVQFSYPSLSAASQIASNPLPSLLHTPFGVCLIEIQGTIHFPVSLDSSASPDSVSASSSSATQVGRLEFPLYNATSDIDEHGNGKEGPWMKKVYLYIGKHQRLVGEVKKLQKALVALVRKDKQQSADVDMSDNTDDGSHNAGKEKEALDVLDIVRYKIIFSGRPEPVGEG